MSATRDFQSAQWPRGSPSFPFNLVGVIIAYARFPEVNRLLHTHCQFQIRTFWIGLLYLVVAGFLAYASFPVIGVAVLIWWLVWSLIRNTTGLLALNENKPIQEPTSWMFGRQPGLRY